MKSFFIVVVLMLRNGGAQTRIGGAPRAKESTTRKLTQRMEHITEDGPLYLVPICPNSSTACSSPQSMKSNPITHVRASCIL